MFDLVNVLESATRNLIGTAYLILNLNLNLNLYYSHGLHTSRIRTSLPYSVSISMPSEIKDRTVALQLQPPPQDTNKSQIQRYMFEPLEANIWTESQPLILTFSTGVQDAVSFPDFL